MPHLVVGIALYGVDPAIFYPFHNSHMVGNEGITAVPLEENKHPRLGGGAAGEPLAPVLKPLHAHAAAGELGDDPRVDVAALVCAPRDKNGAPFHPGAEAVPRPIGLAAGLPDLGLGDCYHVAGSGGQDLLEFLRVNVRAKGGVDIGNQFFIGLVWGEAAYQLLDEIRFFRKRRQRQPV